MKIILLGCGSSPGVPAIGCTCDVCQSPDPKNKRTRVSVAVHISGKTILIDSSPDLRQQALANHLNQVDAVLYTHDHADHTHGLDELRSYNFLGKKPLPVYSDIHTLNDVAKRFPYAFQPYDPSKYGWYKPYLIPHTIIPGIPFTVEGITVLPFEQRHGKSLTIGYRIGDFAYSTDANVIPEESLALLKGLKLWIVDCLRYTPAPTHAHLGQALQWITHVKPERAILTHMNHDIEYHDLKKQLPIHVEPGYDGLVVHM
ncbi:MAG: MBL fold metallo-hydrolase [Alphaproteobacteria bacterium]|nr:MBL fold metallo-hydrolase [Alphaproteobacteria bacterium]